MRSTAGDENELFGLLNTMLLASIKRKDNKQKLITNQQTNQMYET